VNNKILISCNIFDAWLIRLILMSENPEESRKCPPMPKASVVCPRMLTVLSAMPRIWSCFFFFKFYSGTWPSYLIDLLSLRLVGEVKAGKMWRAHSHNGGSPWPGFEPRFLLNSKCSHRWAIPHSHYPKVVLPWCRRGRRRRSGWWWQWSGGRTVETSQRK